VGASAIAQADPSARNPGDCIRHRPTWREKLRQRWAVGFASGTATICYADDSATSRRPNHSRTRTAAMGKGNNAQKNDKKNKKPKKEVKKPETKPAAKR
jgi:hypothetical protein